MTNITYLSHHYDCVGAIDITHFHESIPSKMRARFRGPNDETKQKFLATITFDLKIYVLVGWERSAHDS